MTRAATASELSLLDFYANLCFYLPMADIIDFNEWLGEKRKHQQEDDAPEQPPLPFDEDLHFSLKEGDSCQVGIPGQEACPAFGFTFRDGYRVIFRYADITQLRMFQNDKLEGTIVLTFNDSEAIGISGTDLGDLYDRITTCTFLDRHATQQGYRPDSCENTP